MNTQTSRVESTSVAKYLVAAIIALTAALLLLLASPTDADARSWYKSEDAYETTLTNGKATIYAVSGTDFTGNGVRTFTVYKKNSPSSKAKKLFKKREGSLTLMGYCKGKVYYIASGNDFEDVNMYCFNTKTKKSKWLAKGSHSYQQFGARLIGTANTGDWTPLKLYTINMKNAKAKKITDNACGFKIRGSKIYYLNGKSVGNGSFLYKIMRCKLNGSSKKAVTKAVRGKSCGMLSDEGATINLESGSTRTLSY